jgi:hypothetical protein
MPPTITLLQLAFVVFVTMLPKALRADSPPRKFEVAEKVDRLVIACAGKPVAEYVFGDKRILRPYFANVHAPGGEQVTRSHPPREGHDALDHADMHPGLWLAFGDISGHDFWRNQGRIEHVRFIDKPTVTDGELAFATESRLITREGKELCRLKSRFLLADGGDAWLLVWDATFRSDDGDFTFGDQEEMGFGARVATPLTEKADGMILDSAGLRTAEATWGQAAKWCDYARRGERSAGITLLTSPENFRESWWHNRDYGLFVANPFGRAALKQGEKSAVTVERGKDFRLVFGAAFHDGGKYDPAEAYRQFATRRESPE